MALGTILTFWSPIGVSGCDCVYVRTNPAITNKRVTNDDREEWNLDLSGAMSTELPREVPGHLEGQCTSVSLLYLPTLKTDVMFTSYV